MTRIINRIGHRFGRLVVTKQEPNDKGRVVWRCACDCGNIHITAAINLSTGKTTSCGCFQRESQGDRARTHGKSKTITYRSWAHMHARCYRPTDPKFPRYGGRGITVCEQWHKYENFIADMGERPRGRTLDRKNNDGPYNPDNCQWATPTQQVRNRECSKLTWDKVVIIRKRVAQGESQSAVGRFFGVSPTQVYYIVHDMQWVGA